MVLIAPIAALRERLAPGHHAESFASLHVQTDAVSDVERAVRAFAPRIRSRGTRVVGPRNGWVTVYDEVADSDPTSLVRFAREISSRMGAVVVTLSLEVEHVVRMIALDRGGIVDEYLSVPEFYGPIPPGDVIGLAANPTVLARLTGADPQRIKDAAPTRSRLRATCRPHASCSPNSLRRWASRAPTTGMAATRGRRRRVASHRARRSTTRHAARTARARASSSPRRACRTRRSRSTWRTVRRGSSSTTRRNGRVPVLEEGGWVLPESAVIDEYLEERFPEPSLLPLDPSERAAARLVVFRFDDLGDPYYALRRKEPGAEAALAEALHGLDGFLGATPFLTGQLFGLADVTYLPWLVRLRDLMGVALEHYPAIVRWLDTCADRPSVAAEIETVASLAR